MKYAALGAVGALMMTSGMAQALGLDRSGQDITSIFEPGGFAELSFGMIAPSVSGTDVLGNGTGNVGLDYNQVALAFKMDVTETISLGMIIDQPYGASVVYEGAPAATLLGGTAAELNSRALTLIGRYRFSDAFSAHAGLRAQSMDGSVTLSGLAYDPPGPGNLSGYNLQLENGTGTGWLAGVAYERPAIALRVALTYFSAIDNEFDTLESGVTPAAVAGTTTVTSPEAWNLDFQTGIAQNTLLFGTIRYASYSQTILSPAVFGGATGGGSITDIEDGFAYNIGVGRRFSDAFSGSIALGYEPEGSDVLVSPLSPTNGNTSIAIGGQYTMDNIILSGGVRYTMLGDAFAETGDAARAAFRDNDALAVGFSVGYRF